jgi:site-specific recombinase XerD
LASSGAPRSISSSAAGWRPWDAATWSAVSPKFANRGGVVSTNRAVGRLKAFYSWAVEREYLSDNPTQRIHKLKEFERERRLAPGEEEKLRSVTKDDWLWRLRLVAALETGCRIGELLGVQFKQLR